MSAASPASRSAPAPGPAAPPAVVAERLEVRRGTTVIVSDFDWSHEAGEVAWLVGPNGAGKSSLMRVLAGLAPPAAGRVARRGPPGATVGYFHPAMSLPPESRAREFTRLTDRIVAGAKPLVPDRALARKRVASLSTGEEKRLLLGAILARAREFLLLDEPYEHLSAEARAELTAVLARLAERRVVVVATNQELPQEATGPVLRLPFRRAERA